MFDNSVVIAEESAQSKMLRSNLLQICYQASLQAVIELPCVCEVVKVCVIFGWEGCSTQFGSTTSLSCLLLSVTFSLSFVNKKLTLFHRNSQLG
jgi:hypothetical protein